jgi:acyl carrier protein
VFLRQWPPEGTPALLRALAAETAPARPAQTVTAARVPLIQVLAQLPPEDRLTAIQSHIIEQVAQVLALPAGSVRKDRGFADLGMDSLMALEVRNILSSALGVALSPAVLFEHPSIEALAAHLEQRISTSEEVAVDATATNAVEASGVNAMSEEQVDALLTALLVDGAGGDQV